jgi:imidazole glycerol-phosphate synthase subunit HisH
MIKKALVIDYKTGNVDSVIKAIKMNGYDVIFSSKKKDFDKVSKIILPGQGAYDYAMDQLIKLDLYDQIIRSVKDKSIPILGICLGMQILSDFGLENKKTKGLGLIAGSVESMKAYPEKLPHLGWNSVKFLKTKNKLFSNIKNNKDYYFIHSYYFKCKNKNDVLATTNFNENIASIVNKDLVYGIQFHPEKSLKNGLKLIENFLKINE